MIHCPYTYKRFYGKLFAKYDYTGFQKIGLQSVAFNAKVDKHYSD
jgi:hypothetical protein